MMPSLKLKKFCLHFNHLLMLILLTITVIVETESQDTSKIEPAEVAENANLFRRDRFYRFDSDRPSPDELNEKPVYRTRRIRKRTKLSSPPPSALNTALGVKRGENGALSPVYAPSTASVADQVDSTTARGKRDSSSKIYFTNEMTTERFIPEIGACKGGETYCNMISSYPKDKLDRILQKESSKYSELFGDDVVTNMGDALTQRIDVPGEESLCPSREQLIHPQLGETDNGWEYIVNHDNYTQGVRVEECLTPRQSCLMTDSFPSTYRTECQQRYTFRILLSIDSTGKTRRLPFKFPSCCKCVLIQNDQMRFKRDNNVTPVRRTQPSLGKL